MYLNDYCIQVVATQGLVFKQPAWVSASTLSTVAFGLLEITTLVGSNADSISYI